MWATLRHFLHNFFFPCTLYFEHCFADLGVYQASRPSLWHKACSNTQRFTAVLTHCWYWTPEVQVKHCPINQLSYKKKKVTAALSPHMKMEIFTPEIRCPFMQQFLPVIHFFSAIFFLFKILKGKQQPLCSNNTELKLGTLMAHPMSWNTLSECSLSHFSLLISCHPPMVVQKTTPGPVGALPAPVPMA